MQEPLLVLMSWEPKEFPTAHGGVAPHLPTFAKHLEIATGNVGQSYVRQKRCRASPSPSRTGQSYMVRIISGIFPSLLGRRGKRQRSMELSSTQLEATGTDTTDCAFGDHFACSLASIR